MFFINYEAYTVFRLLLTFGVILCVVVLVLSYALGFVGMGSRKLVAYECGFDPFEDSRQRFDVHFYLIALLFLVFDLEAVFLFPWSVRLSCYDSTSLWVMVDFLVELVVGFYYVWCVGAFFRL